MSSTVTGTDTQSWDRTSGTLASNNTTGSSYKFRISKVWNDMPAAAKSASSLIVFNRFTIANLIFYSELFVMFCVFCVSIGLFTWL